MSQKNGETSGANSGPGKLTVALVAAVVSALLSLSGSYLNTTQTQHYDTQQRLTSERRLAYGKLVGAAIVLKQTEYFRWVSLFSRRYYEGLSRMEQPGGPNQRDYWQQALAADDRQESLALESARARRDFFDTIAMIESLFPNDPTVQERATPRAFLSATATHAFVVPVHCCFSTIHRLRPSCLPAARYTDRAP